jgi:RNA polymerase sigma-70 factor (family 1)
MRGKPPYDERSEREILALLIQGSEYAFTQLFDAHRPRIYVIAYRILKSEELAEEIVQEVFIKVWTRRESLGEILHFSAYINAVARNLIYDMLVRIARERTSSIELAVNVASQDSTERQFNEAEYEALLAEAVNDLTPRQKEMFRMARIEGLSHKAIAERLGVSHLTVKSTMKSAMSVLRQKLGGYLGMIVILALAP